MRTEQLKLNHMYEISKGNAPDYMTSKFEKSTNDVSVTVSVTDKIVAHRLCQHTSDNRLEVGV